MYYPMLPIHMEMLFTLLLFSILDALFILLSDDDGDDDEDGIDDLDGKLFSLDRNTLVDVQFFSSTLDGIITLLHNLVRKE